MNVQKFRFGVLSCLVSLLFLTWPALFPTDLGAGTLQSSKFALHLKTRTTKGTTICTSWSPVPVKPDLTVDPTAPATPCSEFVTQGDILRNYDLYLVVAETNDAGIAGLSCGVSYTGGAHGVAVYSWTRCSNLEFASGGWPASGGGNRITWAAQTHCQNRDVPPNGVQVVAGSFYVYAYGPDTFSITLNRNVSPPELLVADCTARDASVPETNTGYVSFSAGASVPGSNPCTGVACSAVTGLASTSHTVGGWSNHNEIAVRWNDASGFCPGLLGYSILWNTQALGDPDGIVDVTGTSASSGPLADGFWYFHVRAVRAAGGSSTRHLGPFEIDTLPPVVDVFAPRGAGEIYASGQPIVVAYRHDPSGIDRVELWLLKTRTNWVDGSPVEGRTDSVFVGLLPLTHGSSTDSYDWTPTDTTATARLRIVARDPASNTGADVTGRFQISPWAVGVPDPADSHRLLLLQNSPNPFHGSTSMTFAVPPGGGWTALRILDVQGRVVRTLIEGTMPEGEGSVVWDGTDDAGRRVAPGAYLYQLRTAHGERTRRLLVL